GIELLGYQRYGTVQGPRIGKERINGSILKDNDPFINKHTSVSRAKSAASAQQPLSFEHKFNLDRQMLNREEDWPEGDSNVDIESIGEPQLKRLPPLLWLELTALFDKYSLPFQKRKPPKKKRKEEGSVFGVSLETLVRKDMILWEETWSCVPSIFRSLAAALRARTHDEGLFRVSGNKHRRATLRDLLRLGREIVARSDANKMSEHNVAMIIAPTLFPPSLLIKSSDSLETQLATAANSCHVTEALMRWCDELWAVPAALVAASQRKPPPHRRNHHT
ncbi:Rho GTPase-activating protein 18, partial [Operophtera brumata]